ncbi:hypothetical protein GCM10022261_05900 [Brevibacterium daeguense]|uniref:N-acetyltransferase domain-containing protein n=1 Tax=Brevibacterium daeguense TaxID=909936 RepID=A0ABP8EGI3_9MICO|nr:GNAT family N-acetyltransferase [Brevibacterium daeguense]
MSHSPQTVEVDGISVELRHDERLSQFGAYHKDARLSFASYLDRGDQRVFHHTETLPAWGGRGIAGAVVRYALDSTAAEGKKILPACSYVADFVREHDDWNDHLSS